MSARPFPGGHWHGPSGRGRSRGTHRRSTPCVRGASILIMWVALAWPVAFAGAATQAGLASSNPASLAGLRFPPGSRVEPLADRMWLNGAPMQALVFDAPVDVPELIKVLSRQQPAFSDLQIRQGQAILSGWVGDAFWVAQLGSPEGGRSIGSVSSITPVAAVVTDVPDWLPADAQPMLDFTVRQGRGTVVESIWRHFLAPSRLAPVLRQGLLRAGWQQLDRGWAVAWQSWQQRGERLQWMLTPLDGGSGLWIRRWTP